MRERATGGLGLWALGLVVLGLGGCESAREPAPSVVGGDVGEAPTLDIPFHVQIIKVAREVGPSKRAPLDTVDYSVSVQGLSGAEREAIEAGVCEGLGILPEGPRCGGSGSARRLKVRLWSVGKSSTALIGGEVALVGGGKAVYEVELLATAGRGVETPGWRRALGKAVVLKWLTELNRVLVGEQKERLSKGELPASQGLRWLDQPGLRLRDVWPPSDGAVIPVGEGVWSVQMSKEAQIAAFLFDASGRILARPRFNIVEAPGLGLDRWVPDHGRSRLLLSARRVEVEGEGGEEGAVIAALSADGVKLLSALEGVQPLGGAVAGQGDDLYLPALRGGKARLLKIGPEGVSGEWVLPVDASDRGPLVRGVWLDEVRLALLIDTPHPKVLSVSVRKPEAVETLWTWAAPEGRAPLREAGVPLVPDGRGGALVLDAPGARLARVDGAGEVLWGLDLEGGAPHSVALVGDLVVVIGDAVAFCDLAKGAGLGGAAHALRAVTSDAEGRVVACAPTGVLAFTPKGVFVKAMGLSKGCEVLRATPAGFNAGVFPSVLGLGGVGVW